MSKLLQVMISKVLIPAASSSEHLRQYNYTYWMDHVMQHHGHK
jgi:hypothetical protein